MPRGAIRTAILVALRDEPGHGYEVMRRLQEMSGGLWRPSPGSVYPHLQMVEDEGLVSSSEVEGSRTFTLTETGRAEAMAADWTCRATLSRVGTRVRTQRGVSEEGPRRQAE
jgi:DNA-binding PadR family transcriptional regulator